MRTREEIEETVAFNNEHAGPNYAHGFTIVELLLDIRDLLTSSDKTK